MLIYFLKTILIQAIGLGLYFILLRNEKIFSYSRKFLWTVIICSFIIPFISIPVFEATEIVQTISQIPETIVLPEVNIVVSPAKSLGIPGVLLIVYSLITATSLLNLFLAYQKIISIKKRAVFQQPNIYISKEINLPYSFLKNIYIPESFAHQESLGMILAHENAHIQKKHSYDKLVISLLVHLFIFNPLFRIFHKEFELIHEYEVDERVIQVHSIDSYLKSLLQSTIYLQSSKNSLTHSFFSSPIKNRIIMLHKKSRNQNFRKATGLIIMFSFMLIIVFAQSQKGLAQTVNKVGPVLSNKDTSFVRNNNGSYTMTFMNENGQEIKSIVASQEFIRLLSRNRTPKETWSLNEDGGLMVKSNDTIFMDKSELLEIFDTSSDDDIEVLSNDPNASFSVIDNGTGDVKVRRNGSDPNEQVDSEAKFPGGENALIEYVTKNIKYTQDAKEAGMSVKIYVEFMIKVDGSIDKVMVRKIATKISRTSRAGDELFKNKLRQEAIRVIKSMPNWEPAYKKDGEVISSKMILPIEFNK